MNFKRIIQLSFLTSLLVNQAFTISHASEPEEYRSYLNSSFFQQKELPYTQCSIVDRGLDRVIFGGTLAAGVGISTALSYPTTRYLHCSVGDDQSYSYFIPITFDSIVHFGASAALTRAEELKINVKGLNGKPVSSLFSTYRGLSAGLTVLAGPKAGYLRNSNGIQIRYSGVSIGWFGILAGYSSLVLEPRGDILYVSTHSNGTHITPIHMNLENFRFVKISKEKPHSYQPSTSTSEKSRLLELEESDRWN